MATGENWLSRLTRLARRRPTEAELAQREERERQIKAIFGPPHTKHIAGPERTKSSKDND